MNKETARAEFEKWWKSPNRLPLEQPNGGDAPTGFEAGWQAYLAAMPVRKVINLRDFVAETENIIISYRYGYCTIENVIKAVLDIVHEQTGGMVDYE